MKKKKDEYAPLPPKEDIDFAVSFCMTKNGQIGFDACSTTKNSATGEVTSHYFKDIPKMKLYWGLTLALLNLQYDFFVESLKKKGKR